MMRRVSRHRADRTRIDERWTMSVNEMCPRNRGKLKPTSFLNNNYYGWGTDNFTLQRTGQPLTC